MIALADIKDWLKDQFPAAEHYYVGKLSNKHDKSIGVYQRQIDAEPRIALGGLASYETKHVSVLVHWTNDADQTERAAQELFSVLQNITGVKIGNTYVYMIQLRISEPKDVGADEKGIYERVIWFDLYYKKGEIWNE